MLSFFPYFTGNIARAKEIISDVLNSNPQDQLAIRLRSSLDTNAGFLPTYADDTSQILQVLDIAKLPPNTHSELVSPMLLDDLDIAQFHDEIIIQKGEQPDPDDAERLMKQAEETKGDEYEGRYPLFLEAAKAYSKLPEGSYSLENFYRALTRYAMLKGGALVSEFRRQVGSGKTDLEKLKRIRDCATSYYLEALVLQAEVNLNLIILQITNYLRIQLAYALFKRNNPLQDIFRRNLDSLLSYCLRHRDDNIARIAYEIVVSCGAAGEKIWKMMQDKAGGTFTGTLSDEVARKGAYKILGEMSKQEFTELQKPREVLQAAFFARFDQTSHLLSFFNNLRQIHLTQASLPQLHARWQEFPLYLGPLLETDIELYERVGKILDTLRRYQARSAEERTSILYTSRTSIEQLLSFIQEYPTYWGRVGFGGLLTDWRSAIQEIEQKRLEGVQPRLIVRLETATFSSRNGYVEGGIILENTGRATAEGATIVIQLITEDGNLLYKEEDIIDGEIDVNDRRHRRLSFDASLFSEGMDSPYRIDLHVAPIFHQEELGGTLSSFTLEISDSQSGSSSKFTREEIPWNELDIPPKHLFKGREQFIDHLAKHLSSPERQHTYLLYGLTRTGKSTTLRYLGEKIDLQAMNLKGKDYRFISFEWELAKAASFRNARDMWKYLIQTCILEEKCNILLKQGRLDYTDIPVLKHPENIRFRDWEDLIKHFHNRELYPVFLIDEFSYYRNLVDNGQIDASFLASIRSFAIGNQASFVFAGTYDLKEFIRDPKYAVTGQLINIITEKVSRIDIEPATELIQVMEPKLRFTPDAVDHILFLSYQIPYFIQIICKYCAYFALKTGRSILGFPEVDTVVQALTGEQEVKDLDIGVERLPSGVFMNNLQSDSDSIEYQVLLSSICYIIADTRGHSETPRPRMVTLPEIQELWHHRGLDSFQAKLAGAISELIEREVLIEGKDEGLPAYRISVDLFRRWLASEHPVIEREIDKLKGN